MSAAPISVQCSTGPFWAFELDHALDIVAAAGFTEVELMVTRDPQTQEPETPLRLAEERGLRIASIHGPFLVVSKSVWGMDPIAKIERGIDMCKAVGARTLIVHPPFLWERTYARWIGEDALARFEEDGVPVVVETMYPKWVAGRRLRGYRWLDPHELVAACPHVALDTSHLAVSRLDILDAYGILAPKLEHIHLSDNLGDGRDGHLGLGDGTLPIDRFLGELRRTRYAGDLSLELSVHKYIERESDLVKVLEKNRLHVQEKLKYAKKMTKGLPRI
jgi:sugar phosphate isomerase/epimerase